MVCVISIPKREEQGKDTKNNWENNDWAFSNEIKIINPEFQINKQTHEIKVYILRSWGNIKMKIKNTYSNLYFFYSIQLFLKFFTFAYTFY